MPRLDIPAYQQENYITITSEELPLGSSVWNEVASDIEELLATKYHLFDFEVDLDDREA